MPCCQPNAPRFTNSQFWLSAELHTNTALRGNSIAKENHSPPSNQQDIASMRYRKLRKDRDEIRLLTIIDDASEPITCQLEHVSLAASPSYKALSYCWGDASDTQPVVINGRTMAVTVNLESALRQFRGEGHGWLWIDAVCINQSDLGEKGEQVLKMGGIFSKATEVVTWLGPEEDDSELAMEFMRTFGEHAAEVLSKEPMLDWARPISREECRAHDEDSWSALEALFRRRYWTRLWTVQEMVLASRVIVRCGKAEASFDDLCAAVWITDRRTFRPSFPDRGLGHTYLKGIYCVFCLVFNQACGGRTGSFQPKDIMIALSYTKYHLTTDPRDKVYGILALTTDGSELIGNPSYGEPTEDLYIRLTRSLISTRKRLDFMSFKAPVRNYDLKLPSWALDLSSPCFPSDPIRPSYFHVPLLWPEVDMDLSKPIILDHPGVEDCRILKIAGIRIDVIDGVGVAGERIGGSTIVQPDNMSNGYDSDIDMRYAIVNSIFQLWKPIEDVVEGDGTAQLIVLGWQNLWQPKKRTSYVPRQEALIKWQDQNRDLLIAGRRLEDWAVQGPGRLPLTIWRKLWEKESLREEDLTNGVAHNLLLNYIFPQFQEWNVWNKKILITKNGYFGTGHPQARKGDLICCLKDVWNPVVLRAKDNGVFQLVGDAEVHGFDKGMKGFLKLQNAIDEGRTETFHLV